MAAYAKVPVELREVVLGQVLTRADWSLALVQALAEKKIDLLTLGPSNLHRLRTHPDKAVATRANAVIDELKISSKDRILNATPDWNNDRVVRETTLSRYYLPPNPNSRAAPRNLCGSCRETRSCGSTSFPSTRTASA